MSLEQSIDNLAEALNNLAEAFNSGGSVKTETTKPAKAEKKKGKKSESEDNDSEDKDNDSPLTDEDVRNAAMPLIKAGRSDEVGEILTKFDAKNISGLKKKHYTDVIEALGELDD